MINKESETVIGDVEFGYIPDGFVMITNDNSDGNLKLYTYYSNYAILTGYYDMSTSKDYTVSAVVYVTANEVREKIEL